MIWRREEAIREDEDAIQEDEEEIEQTFQEDRQESRRDEQEDEILSQSYTKYVTKSLAYQRMGSNLSREITWPSWCNSYLRTLFLHSKTLLRA